MDGEASQRDEVCAAVAALKRAAEQFGELLVPSKKQNSRREYDDASKVSRIAPIVLLSTQCLQFVLSLSYDTGCLSLSRAAIRGIIDRHGPAVGSHRVHFIELTAVLLLYLGEVLG